MIYTDDQLLEIGRRMPDVAAEEAMAYYERNQRALRARPRTSMDLLFLPEAQRRDRARPSAGAGLSYNPLAPRRLAREAETLTIEQRSERHRLLQAGGREVILRLSFKDSATLRHLQDARGLSASSALRALIRVYQSTLK